MIARVSVVALLSLDMCSVDLSSGPTEAIGTNQQAGTKRHERRRAKARAGLEIVSNGVSQYVIYVEEDAPDSVEEGAEELRRLVGLATGADLPIVRTPTDYMIALGDTPAARRVGIKTEELKWEGYRLRVVGNSVFIAGRDTSDSEVTPAGGQSFGTLYGVYELLEDFLGVRWLLPGTAGEVVPATSRLELPRVNRVYAPRFPNRQLFVGRRNDPDTRLWLRRQRLGGSQETLAHAHAWDQYIAADELAAHPQWLAEVGGVPSPADSRFVKLNTTSEELLDAFTEGVVALVDSGVPRLKHSVSISPSDGDGWDERPESVALWRSAPSPSWGDYGGYGVSRTDLILTFYNEIAQRLEATHPDLRVGGLAYASYAFPPESGIVIHPNVNVVWAPRHAYGLTLYRTAVAKEYLRAARAWERVSPRFHLYDFTGWIRGFYGAPVPPAEKLLGRMLRAHKGAPGRQMHVNGISAWGYGALHNYLVARLLWKPDSDIERAARDWLDSAYGDASADVAEIYDVLDCGWSEYVNGNDDWHTEVTRDMLEQIYLANYWELEELAANGASRQLSMPQRERLDLLLDNMRIMTWRLLQLGLKNAISSSLFLSDADLLDYAQNRADDLAFWEGWADGISLPGDLPRFFIDVDDTPIDPTLGWAQVMTSFPNAGSISTVPTVATPYASGSDTGARIQDGYVDSQTGASMASNLVVLRDSDTTLDVALELIGASGDTATSGTVQTRFDILLASEAASGNVFVTWTDPAGVAVATLLINAGGTTRLSGNGPYTDLTPFPRRRVVRLQMDIDLDSDLASLSLDGQTWGIVPIDATGEFSRFRINTTGPGTGVIAVDNVYVGAP